jgi:hypothetical protein
MYALGGDSHYQMNSGLSVCIKIRMPPQNMHKLIMGTVISLRFLTLATVAMLWAVPTIATAQNLYVSDYAAGTVNEYDATTGATVPGFSISGLEGPRDLALSGNDLYVASNSTVSEYDATTGAIIPGFSISVGAAAGLALSGNDICFQPRRYSGRIRCYHGGG